MTQSKHNGQHLFQYHTNAMLSTPEAAQVMDTLLKKQHPEIHAKLKKQVKIHNTVMDTINKQNKGI